MNWCKCFNNLKLISFIFLFIVMLIGCASMSDFREVSWDDDPVISYRHILSDPTKELTVGEVLEYRAYWTGIPAGHVTLTTKEITEYENEEIYIIKAEAYTNEFFSIIYRIRAKFKSYLERKNLYSKYYEFQSTGRRKAKGSAKFDYENLKAYTEDNCDTKSISIPGKIQDPLSSLYVFRTKNIDLGKSIIMDVNIDERNWQLEWYIEKFGKVNLVNLGIFDALLVKPIIIQDGKKRQDRDIEVWFTADEKRIPLVVKLDVPLGNLKLVIKEIP